MYLHLVHVAHHIPDLQTGLRRLALLVATEDAVVLTTGSFRTEQFILYRALNLSFLIKR